ncbi:Hpt domain-containing protein [Alteromonas macleodii]|jgi:HPt (histidine-containing phosphotransfer) domain-containing protein|uniref:Hpt domain-containing protein n=1 Tax=Alteromonas macleodii TaxID=28108 RepID=UPI002E835E03|nr:Hpt domain-containing protein [Enterobacterales bacterium]MCP3702715.1 Hpt domain-containing protein [Alteromonas sp.]MEC9428997.1 Hpt domain-containing protein [Pseudomonadota bacterium]MEE3130622.1 Hpt domain-containing protein [Pseudomonadota bacterium]
MDQSTTVVDIDFGMSQLSGNKKLLFTLLGKFTDEYRSLDADLQAHVAKGDFNKAYSIVHTLKGVTGNLGLFALHNASKPVESGFRNDKRVAEQYPAFIAVLDETIAAVDALIKEPEVTASAPAPANGAAAEQARKQLMTALKASEFIAQDKLDEWLDALALPQEKRSAIIDAVDELDYEEAISELENS